jgi:predicted Zn-dependent protease
MIGPRPRTPVSILLATAATLLTSGCGCSCSDSVGCRNDAAFVPNYLANFADTPRWRNFPVRIAFARNAGYTDAWRQTVLNGLNQWAQATNRILSYREVGVGEEADITVELYNAASTPAGPPGATTLDADDGIIHSARIQIATVPANAAEIQQIAAHEFGHALGLSRGHSDLQQDLMFGYPYQGQGQGNPPLPPKQVTTRDLNTVRALYCDRF